MLGKERKKPDASWDPAGTLEFQLMYPDRYAWSRLRFPNISDNTIYHPPVDSTVAVFSYYVLLIRIAAGVEQRMIYSVIDSSLYAIDT